MLPLLDAELVQKRQWLTKEEMVDCIAIAQSMPGIIGANISVSVGYKVAGISGALAATAGMIAPPFLTILLVAMCFLSISGNRWIDNAFAGIRAAICALILLSAIKLGKSILKAPFPILLASISFCILTFLPQINAIWTILGAAAAGLIRMVFLQIQERRKGKRKEP